MRDAGAGMLVTNGPTGMMSVFVPVVVSDDRRTIRTHVARANPWWRAIGEGADVLGLFLAASAYVSPSYYPSRFSDPGVVPTWNYVAAEVRGRAHVHDDTDWKASQIRQVTTRFEDGREPTWTVDDAPEDYIERQLRAIVGIEIDLISIDAKSKLSQNRPVLDGDSVRQHLSEGTPTEQNVAQRMSGDAK